MHGVHHHLQGGIDNRLRFFRIEAFNQGGGAFEVGKQGGDGLALTVGNLSRTNALGEMGGSIASFRGRVLEK
jgi:hypothetical protein